jgi:hypothetical protein
MNRALIAPVAVIVTAGLKQYLNVDITESQVEAGITFLAIVGGAIWAALTEPKKVKV